MKSRVRSVCVCVWTEGNKREGGDCVGRFKPSVSESVELQELNTLQEVPYTLEEKLQHEHAPPTEKNKNPTVSRQ